MTGYDVFISYSRADTEAAELLDRWLRENGLVPFFDRRELDAGLPWVGALARALAHSRSTIVLVGPAGIGNTQQYESALAFIRQTKHADFPLIPVLLPGTDAEYVPFDFLQLLTWIDFSKSRSIFDDPQQLQRLLAAIRGERQEKDGDLAGAICPYRGLEPFREEDAAFFFGRDRTIEHLATKAREHAVLVVVGQSGSGKSSLVLAGLLPVLRRALTPVWDVVTLRPGEYPLRAIVAAFDPPEPGDGEIVYAAEIKKREAVLRRGDDRQLADLVKVRLSRSEIGVERLLIYVDQWEELYTRAARPERDSDDASRPSDDDTFVRLLLAATEHAPVTLVLSVRSDHYDQLQRSEIGQMLPAQQVNVLRMEPEDWRAAIEGPAAKVRLRFEPPSLVDEILNDLGPKGDVLPDLQYALQETWKRRQGSCLTAHGYVAAGRVETAIKTRADAIYASLPSRQQAAVRSVFLGLVAVAPDREPTRVPLLQPEAGPLREVIEMFAAPRVRLLVTGADDDGRPIVELAHEALLRTWPMLKDWIDQNRQSLIALDYFRAQRREWERNGKREDLLIRSRFQLKRAHALVANDANIPVHDVVEYVEHSRRTARWTSLKRMSWVIAMMAGAAVVAFYVALYLGRDVNNDNELVEESRTDRLDCIARPHLPAGTEPASFIDRVVQVAEREYEVFRRGDAVESGAWCVYRIANYYDTIGLPYPGNSREISWSAVFISFLMKEAGAGDRFVYSQSHASYIYEAVRNADRADAPFRGLRLEGQPVRVGDVVCRDRGTETLRYDDVLIRRSFRSMCAVVTALSGRTATLMGGNVRSSIVKEPLALKADGSMPDGSWFVIVRPYL